MPNLVIRGKVMRIPARFPLRRLAFLPAILVWIALLAACHNHYATPVLAADLKPIDLPKPQITAGMPLMQALAQRKTTRAFRDKPLPLQTLSNLLWAAFGVNRPPLSQAGTRSHRAFGHEQPGR